jgi:hypothetical protein
MCRAHQTREAILTDFDRRHRVETQKRQIGQVVAGQRLRRQVSVETPQSAEAPLGDTKPLQVGKHDLARVAHDNPLDLAFAVDEDADLTTDLTGDFGELTGEIVRYELTRREPPLVEFL